MSISKIIRRNLSKLNIVEVGPRDGLQNEKKILSVTQRIELINRLQKCGFNDIEVGSFVNPKAVPQMANTADVLRGVQKLPGTRFSVLVPNKRGWDDVPKDKVDEVVFIISATEGFNKSNLGASTDYYKGVYQSLAAEVYDSGLDIRGSISCCCECPFDGKTDPDRVLRLIEFYKRIGAKTIDLADTIGRAQPHEVAKLLLKVKSAFGLENIAGHFHDSNGWAIPNIMVASQLGVRTFHSSISGIGGCPFSPNRVGNVATERLLDIFRSEQIDRREFDRTKTWLDQQLRVIN